VLRAHVSIDRARTVGYGLPLGGVSAGFLGVFGALEVIFMAKFLMVRPTHRLVRKPKNHLIFRPTLAWERS